MSKGWTEERRQKQRERIRQTKPWEKSTGPKTDMGKIRSSLNALKHGNRSGLWQDHINKILGLNDVYVQQVMLMHTLETKHLTMAKELLKKSNKNNEGVGGELKE